MKFNLQIAEVLLPRSHKGSLYPECMGKSFIASKQCKKSLILGLYGKNQSHSLVLCRTRPDRRQNADASYMPGNCAI